MFAPWGSQKSVRKHKDQLLATHSFLLGLSKGNARVEIAASFFFFRSVANRSEVLITHTQPFDL